MSSFIKNLSELNENSLLEAGGKGANLGVLINAGLPVPSGFTIISRAYKAQLNESNLYSRIAKKLEVLTEENIKLITEVSNEISLWIEKAPMPIEIENEITKSYEDLCMQMNTECLQVAVRSSATAEDLPTASFAGQQETFLGIHGKEAVLLHVKKCWASLWTAQAISYRMSMGFEHLKVDLAVVVQAMIPSESAGVMFTANPVTGCKDELLISASYGLGEAVVSGLVTPDTYILSKKSVVKEKNLGTKELKIVMAKEGTITEEVPVTKQKIFCLGDGELSQLTELATKVESYYGSPQDTEWGLSKGKIYLLQARPITTMSSFGQEINVLEPGDEIIYKGKKPPFGLSDTMEHAPEPMTPLDFSYYCCGDYAFQKFLRNMGLRMPKERTAPVERRNGVISIKLSQAKLSPSMLWKLPVFLLKKASKDPKDSWQPVYDEMATWLKKMTLAERNLKDVETEAMLVEQALDEFEGLIYKRFLAVFMSGIVTNFKLSHLIKKVVGKENAAEMKERLLRALPFRTALQNQALTKAAKVALQYGEKSKEFDKEFSNLMKVYGDRPSTGMIPMLNIPTWNEKPEVVHELIQTLLRDTESLNLEDSFKKQKDDYKTAKRSVEGALSPKKRRKFQTCLERARNGVIVREESLFMLESLTAFIRRMILKLGELLVEKSIINEAEDVFFLFATELRSAAKGTLNVKERIKLRKSAFAKVCAANEQGIHWMISTGSFPVFEPTKKKKLQENDSNSLHGLAASRGVYEGTVCIIKSPSEFSKLNKDDILVATFTAPVWTPLFRIASAVVTEIGSPVSHAAIVAREYNIPAVVAVDNVTNILKDGQKIRVDGINGTVTIL